MRLKKLCLKQKAQMICNQLQISSGFFICVTIVAMIEIAENSLSADSWHADLAGTAFVKITAVYGNVNENGRFVRNWLA